VGEERRDFFISYTSADETWTEWIAWELEAAGYRVLIQAWDFRPGVNFVTAMQEGRDGVQPYADCPLGTIPSIQLHRGRVDFSLCQRPDGWSWTPYTSSCGRTRPVWLASCANLRGSRRLR
jgi:hypothetical protein